MRRDAMGFSDRSLDFLDAHFDSMIADDSCRQGVARYRLILLCSRAIAQRGRHVGNAAFDRTIPDGCPRWCA